MAVNFANFIGSGFGYGCGVGFNPSWGGNFTGCCQRTLGAQRSGMTGALLGGLVGTIAGCGNPLTGLLGAGIGGLLGSIFGGNNHNHHGCHSPQHCGAGSYPPPCGGGFGGIQYGGYGCPPNYGSPYGGGYGGGGFPGGGYGNGYGNGSYCPSYPQQFPGGCSPWGGQYQQQWGGGNCCPNPSQNFNYGNQCPPQCCPGQRPGQGGELNQEGKGKPIEYKTSGGYTVKIDKHTITITDPTGKNTQETWGDPHQKVNGKNIGDWQGKQRTIVLGDGTKITMSANSPTGVVNSTSIYDGRINVQVENASNTVSHMSMNPRDTAYREQSQHDGDTALFITNPRTGVANFNEIYRQDQNFNITNQYRQVAQTGGYADPNGVLVRK